MIDHNFSSDGSHSAAYVKMMLDVFQEHLRQARYTFSLSVVTVVASIGISVLGAVGVPSLKTISTGELYFFYVHKKINVFSNA